LVAELNRLADEGGQPGEAALLTGIVRRQRRDRRQICRRPRATVVVGHEKPVVAGECESAMPCLDVLRVGEQCGQLLDDLVGVPEPGRASRRRDGTSYDTTLSAISMAIGIPNPSCSLRAS
jgi:hypothetical protein